MSKGGAFIHDPKLAFEAEIKAKVKLQFRDRAGNQVIVSRIMQATQKPNKVETRTLDSSMEKHVNGEKVQVTSRCADVDEEMMHHLGVSRAVLNNVLFCHQEDSTWPLSESKVLKKKFDAIFDASKYSKALENVKEIMKQQSQKAKECTLEIKYLGDLKTKADEHVGDLRQTEQKIDQQRRTLQRLDEELSPIETRLQELDGLFDKVAEMEKEIASLKSRQDQIQKDARELSLKIKDPHHGPVEELEEKHSSYNVQLDKKRKSLQKIVQRMRDLEHKRQTLENKVARLFNEHGKLLAEAERQREREADIKTQVKTLSSQLGLKVVRGTDAIGQEDIRQFLGKMLMKVAEMEDAVKREKESFEAQETTLQKKIDNFIHSLATLEQSHKLKVQQREENLSAISKKSRELQDISASSTSLVNLEEELETAEMELAEHNSSVDVSSLEDQLSVLQTEKESVERAVRELQEELTRATKQAEMRGAIKELKKEKAKREEQLATMESSTRGDLSSLFTDIPPVEELAGKLERLLRTKSTDLEKARKLLTQARRQQSDQEAAKRMKGRELTSAREKLSRLEGMISSVCGSHSFEDAVKDNEEEIHKTQEDITGTRGSEPFFKMCIEKVEQTKKCPVCVRKFEGKADTAKCVENLRQRISSAIPRILTGLQQSLEKLQKNQKQLLELRPSIEEVKELRSHRIPSLESELTRTSSEVERCQQDAMTHETNVTVLEDSVRKIQGLQHQAVGMGEISESLVHLDRRIRSEEGRIPASARRATRDQNVVTKDLKKNMSQNDDLTRQINNLREEIDENISRRRSLEKEVHEFREQKLRFQEQVNRKDQLQKSRSELEVKNEDISRELQSIKSQLQPLQGDKKSAENEKKELLARKERALRDSRSKIDDLQSKYQKVKTLDDDIRSFVDQGCADAVEDSKRDMEATKEDLEVNKQDTRELQKERNELESSLSSAEVRLRELEDSIQLVKKQGEVRRLSSLVQQKEREMRQKGFDQFEQYVCIRTYMPDSAAFIHPLITV
jgi:DNA repair protein RAD50